MDVKASTGDARHAVDVKREPLCDEAGFVADVLGAYAAGRGADLAVSDHDARATAPPGTAAARDLSYVAADLPAFDAGRCTGCMECVIVCPDSALLARVRPADEIEARLSGTADATAREAARPRFTRTRKFHDVPQKRGLVPALFGLFVDPRRCKGCGECVAVCGEGALAMRDKAPGDAEKAMAACEVAASLPEPDAAYVQERVPADWMLADRACLYTGGAGSCRGCGEATALRMMLAACGFAFGASSVGIVAATGCNSVFGSTWPYNPFRVPWTNSLFENAPAVAMGLRLRWDQRGFSDGKIWAVGGDGAMCDIGFGSLSRLLASGMDVNALVLDTQVYSNTGGQSSTATYLSQNAKMATVGRERAGKTESRKEIGLLALAHGDVFVAQTTPAHIGHFYRSVVDAATFPGPSLVNVYCACQPEHGIPDDASTRQAKLAVTARAFPVFTYDPRRGASLRERLSLQGNPSVGSDWHVEKSGETVDFVAFARTEGRFGRQFGPDGTPSAALLLAREERLRNWRRLREIAGAA